MAITEHQIYLFFLILVRTTSMFMSAPAFSDRAIPARYKIGLGGLVSLLLLPVVDGPAIATSFNHLTAIILVLKEMLTGIIIGFALTMLFAGVEFAGEYVSLDMGFSLVQVYDPTFNQTFSIIARLKSILAILIFLIIDGHHFLLQAVVYSYEVIPVGGWQLSYLAVDKLMRISAQVFVIGIKIAAPAIVALFLTSVAMGIIARAVPQMNIFFVGIPVRIVVGLVFLALGFPLFVMLFHKLLTSFETDIVYLLQVL